MEKLIFEPTGKVVEVDAACVEKMLTNGFKRATTPARASTGTKTPAKRNTRSNTKKAGKNESKNS